MAKGRPGALSTCRVAVLLVSYASAARGRPILSRDTGSAGLLDVLFGHDGVVTNVVATGIDRLKHDAAAGRRLADTPSAAQPWLAAGGGQQHPPLPDPFAPPPALGGQRGGIESIFNLDEGDPLRNFDIGGTVGRLFELFPAAPVGRTQPLAAEFGGPGVAAAVPFFDRLQLGPEGLFDQFGNIIEQFTSGFKTGFGGNAGASDAFGGRKAAKTDFWEGLPEFAFSRDGGGARSTGEKVRVGPGRTISKPAKGAKAPKEAAIDYADYPAVRSVTNERTVAKPVGENGAAAAEQHVLYDDNDYYADQPYTIDFLYDGDGGEGSGAGTHGSSDGR